MELGICTGPDTFSHRPAGLDFIEANVQKLLAPGAGDDDFAPNLEGARACPVPVRAANCFLPGDLKSTGPHVDPDALDAYVRVAMGRAARVGIDTIVFGSGGSRQVPDGFDRNEAAEQLAGHLRRWGPIAADNGVTIVVEPLQKRDCNIINTVAEGADLVRRVDHPGVRLLADTFHMACDGDPPEAIEAAGALMGHVHCAEKTDRARPGVNDEDLRPYFRALKAAGYAGRVSIEAAWTDMPAEADEALAALARQIDEA